MKKYYCVDCQPRNNCDFVKTENGYCCYSEYNDEMLIFNLYVYEEFRCKGESRNLICQCITNIRNSGYTGAIKIQADPSEDSIPKDKLTEFYKSMGLVVIQ